MVETIAPVVHGNRRNYWIAITIHTSAATFAATTFGALLGVIGLAFGAPWIDPMIASAVLVGAGLLYSARELLGLPVPLFDRKQQVPDWWRTFYSPPLAAALYGAGLGIGFLTYLRHGTYVVVAIVALVSGNPLTGALVTAPFGLARGLSVIAGARARDENDSNLIVASLERAALSRAPRLVNGGACLVLAFAGAALIT